MNKKPVSIKERKQSFLSQFFFVVFFVVVLVFFFASGLAFSFDFGGPKVTSFIAAKSLSVYIPVGPTYLKGVIPLRCNRFFTASVDMLPPRALAMSFTVISIPHYRYATYKNQVGKAPFSRKWDILLYVCIAKNGNIFKISENFFQNLDRAISILYTVLMSRMWDIQNGTGETGSLNGSTVAKGDFYEREQRDNK